MEKETQKFLEAEETAAKLVETLKQLYSESTSYQMATKELDVVRQQLLNLIESTEKVVSNSHEIVRILKEIGGPEILNRLTKIEDKLSEEVAKVVNTNLEIDRILKESKSEILTRLTKVEDKSTEQFDKQTKSLKRLKTLIIVTLTSSIIAIIIGIIGLLR